MSSKVPSPRFRESVDALIQRVMAEHPNSNSPATLLKYFEAVHQELAPLARDLEAENVRLREQLQEQWRAAAVARRPSLIHKWTCPACSNVFRGGDKDITVYVESGVVYCKACNPRMRRADRTAMHETTLPNVAQE